MNLEERKEKHEEIEEAKVEFEFDMDNMPAKNHNWVDRGMFLSCERAGHPNHRHHITGKRVR